MQGLTDKEIAIAKNAAAGMTAQQIGDAMCLSPETIRWYRKRMLQKCNTRNFTELIAVLKDQNII